MAFSEDLHIGKFLVKQKNNMCYIFKYHINDDVYTLYKKLPIQNYQKNALNSIVCMTDSTEFIAVYNRLDGIRTIYKVIGVRK